VLGLREKNCWLLATYSDHRPLDTYHTKGFNHGGTESTEKMEGWNDGKETGLKKVLDKMLEQAEEQKVEAEKGKGKGKQ